jgi:hypothetical protein
VINAATDPHPPTPRYDRLDQTPQRILAHVTGSAGARPEGGPALGLGVSARREAQLQKKSLFATEQDRPDVARRREQCRQYQGLIDPKRLVFIDETWTKTNMAPLRGSPGANG